MALGKLPVPRRPTMWMIVGQGLIALAAGAGHIFTHLYPLIGSLRVYIGPSPKEREKGQRRLKMSKHLHRTYCKCSRPLPYYNPCLVVLGLTAL